jgi:hypothetical protein
MAPEGEGKFVVNACQDCNEVCLESLDGALCLTLFVVSRWYQFKLYLLQADVLLERL